MSAAAPPAVDVVARARDILAGRLVPPPLELSPERKAILDRLIHEHVTPTPEAYQRSYEGWAFDEYGDGETVLYTRLPDGKIAILGRGLEDCQALSHALTAEEWGRVDLQYTGSWDLPSIRGY